MQSKAVSIAEYLASLPVERQGPVARLREVIGANIDPRFEERMSYGMIGWVVPHSIYPAGYHCTPELPLPFINLASQKNYVSLYLFCLYIDPKLMDWFTTRYAKTGFRLDMGKSCLRFKRMDQIPYELIGKLVKKMKLEAFLDSYEKAVKS